MYKYSEINNIDIYMQYISSLSIANLKCIPRDTCT